MPIRDTHVYLRVPAPRNSIHFHFHVLYTEPRASVRRCYASYAGHLRGINRTAHQGTVRTYVPTRARMRAGTRVRYHFMNQPARGAPRGTHWECTLIEITTMRSTVLSGRRRAMRIMSGIMFRKLR